MRKLTVKFLFGIGMLIFCLPACKQKSRKINFTHQVKKEKDSVKM